MERYIVYPDSINGIRYHIKLVDDNYENSNDYLMCCVEDSTLEVIPNGIGPRLDSTVFYINGFTFPSNYDLDGGSFEYLDKNDNLYEESYSSLEDIDSIEKLFNKIFLIAMSEERENYETILKAEYFLIPRWGIVDSLESTDTDKLKSINVEDEGLMKYVKKLIWKLKV